MRNLNEKELELISGGSSLGDFVLGVECGFSIGTFSPWGLFGCAVGLGLFD